MIGDDRQRHRTRAQFNPGRVLRGASSLTTMPSREASSSSTSTVVYPFANSKGVLEILPNRIDVEEESRLYDEMSRVGGSGPYNVIISP
jgi:hypothetical protein